MPVLPEGQPRAAVSPGAGAESGSSGRSSLDPSKLAYLMGPAALGAILLLMRFGEVAKEPIWLWVAVFVAVPVASIVADHLYDASPTRRATPRSGWRSRPPAVTSVIYLIGLGPGPVRRLRLPGPGERGSHGGSRVWRVTALWSLVGIAVGQVGHLAEGGPVRSSR